MRENHRFAASMHTKIHLSVLKPGLNPEIDFASKAVLGRSSLQRFGPFDDEANSTQAVPGKPYAASMWYCCLFLLLLTGAYCCTARLGLLFSHMTHACLHPLAPVHAVQVTMLTTSLLVYEAVWT